MATLSVFKDGGKAANIVASPIYLLGALSGPGLIAFELLAKDASGLAARIGLDELYALDGDAFWGRLEHLTETDPIHPVCIALRRPVMRGAIRRLSELGEYESVQ
jgi:hypothetical protein